MFSVQFLFCIKLLGITLQNEKPELEIRKTEMLKQGEDLKIELAKIEQALLEVFKTIITTIIIDHKSNSNNNNNDYQ